MNDPDPNDDFCDDDCLVCCKIKLKDEEDEAWDEYCVETLKAMGIKKSHYHHDDVIYRCITVSCRPYNLRKECEYPDWCPMLITNEHLGVL